MIIGIDLGTTNSVAAVLGEDGPRLIQNALGQSLTPSVVAIDEQNSLLVGRTAKEFQVTNPQACMAVFKRYMGSDWKTSLNGRTFTPEQLSSLVLRQLKQDAEASLGEQIADVVITVPAYFQEPQRKATIQAGRIAGFNVRRILNEPTAAALAYGFHEAREDKILVVLDLGGGTFDVSVVEHFGGTLEVRASAGESFLGGEDFTRTMTARVLESMGLVFERIELEAPKLVSRLMQQCESAKCLLSRQELATVRIPDRRGEYHDDSPVAEITREQFYKWTENILARIEMPIRRALGDAGLKPADVQEVILAGGATRMPQFQQRIAELFGRPPQCRLNPDEVVALGAAVQAGLIADHRSVEDLVVTDVCPFTLGIEISKNLGDEHRPGYFMPILHRNTTIPASRVERVNTVRPNQPVVSVKVFQGEGRRVENNLLLGEFDVPGIPSGPAGQEVDVRLTYDLNGVLEVEATIVETKQRVTHLITRHARGMSEADIARAVAEMQTLKTHPREESVNRFLLQRAERLFQELPRTERGWLTSLLDGFESALALQDAEAIAKFREELTEFLDRFDLGLDENGTGGEHEL